MSQTSPEFTITPVAFQPLFSACVPTDGAAKLGVTTPKGSLRDLDMVWNVPDVLTWDVQFNNPLGESQLEIKRRKGVFSSMGSKTVNIHKDENSALVVDDLVLPILDSEFPCLLSGYWPASWLTILRPVTETRLPQKTGFMLAGEDDQRRMSLTATIDQDAKHLDSCVEMQWGGFWIFFRRNSRICLQRTSSEYQVTIEGPAGISCALDSRFIILMIS